MRRGCGRMRMRLRLRRLLLLTNPSPSLNSFHALAAPITDRSMRKAPTTMIPSEQATRVKDQRPRPPHLVSIRGWLYFFLTLLLSSFAVFPVPRTLRQCLSGQHGDFVVERIRSDGAQHDAEDLRAEDARRGGSERSRDNHASASDRVASHRWTGLDIGIGIAQTAGSSSQHVASHHEQCIHTHHDLAQQTKQPQAHRHTQHELRCPCCMHPPVHRGRRRLCASTYEFAELLPHGQSRLQRAGIARHDEQRRRRGEWRERFRSLNATTTTMQGDRQRNSGRCRANRPNSQTSCARA